MKKHLFSLLIVLAALCSLTLCASAAEIEVSVQLDGQNLEFTDAKPQVKDSRTFLPFRAVFEALGAQVSNEGNLVTATRGDTTLTMTIGETTASVTKGGVTEELTMDVAPYVDNTTWRTYVPVRFAADAFGCNVGWDQAAMTAVIVDVDKLVDEALAGKEFTMMDKFTQYSQQYGEGNWAVDGAMDAAVSLMGSEAMPLLTGTVTGLTAGETAGEMRMVMDIDMVPLMSYIAGISGSTLEDMGAAEEELAMSMVMEMKLDLNTGVIYILLDDATGAMMGLEPGAWLSMDMNTVLAQSGMGWDDEAMLAQTEAIDTAELLKDLLASVSLDGQAAEGYTTLADTLNSVITALSDEGFQAADGGYVSTLALADMITFTLELSTDGDGVVNGYAMDLDMIIPLDEATKAILAQSGLPLDSVSMSMYATLDQEHHMGADISISASPLFAMDMTMTMDYTPSTDLPNTTLPEGAVTVDYLDLLYGITE